MPRPPPPAAALTTRGKPISRWLARGDDRDAGLTSDLLRRELVSADPERLRRRPDEDEAGCLDRLGEGGALGEEAIPGVDCVGTGLLGGADVLVGREISGDLDELVRGSSVERRAIVRRRDGDGAMPSRRQVRKIRTAISPRFATRSFFMRVSPPRASPGSRR